MENGNDIRNLNEEMGNEKISEEITTKTYETEPEPSSYDEFMLQYPSGGFKDLLKGLKNNRKFLFMGGIGIGLIVFIVIFVIAVSSGINNSKPGTINLNEYVSVTFGGYHKIGEAEVYFNKELFCEENSSEIKFISKKAAKQFESEYGISSDNPIDAFVEMFSVSLDTTSGLANGDVVSLVWDVSEEDLSKYFKYDIVFSADSYTVETLEVVELFDPFSNIELIFAGTSSTGTLSLNIEDLSGVYERCRYNPDKYENISNGDTLTVTFSIAGVDKEEEILSYMKEQYHMIPSSLSKEYVVSGLDSLATELGMISSDSMNEMNLQGQNLIRSYAANTWDPSNTLNSMECLGYYFLTPKEEYSQSEYDPCKIFAVFKINTTWNASCNYDSHDAGDVYTKSQTFDFYYVVEYDSAVIKADGSSFVDVMNYYIPEHTFTQTFTGEVNNCPVTGSGFVFKDDVIKCCVDSNSEYYDYETNIEHW